MGLVVKAMACSGVAENNVKEGAGLTMGNAQYAISVDNLWLKYREGGWLLKGLSLKVLDGESVLIIGSSGGGKTSLARALTGTAAKLFGAEIKGRIEVCSKDINEMEPIEIQRCVQVVNQDPYTHFLEPIAIDDLMSYAEKLYGGSRAGEIVDYIVKQLKIEDIVQKPITNLSGGQLRRLAIAKALMANPRILVFDEPLMWLDDIEGVDIINSIIYELKRLNKTVIVMEHRFMYLLDKVDRIYVLKDGVLHPVTISQELEAVKNRYKDDRFYHPHNSRGFCERVLELDNVWFKYEDEPSWVLKGVTLNVCHGDTVVIYGRNGSGKSTLLRIMAGILRPTRGVRKIHRKMLYVPQVSYLFFTEDSIMGEIQELCKAWRLGEDCINKAVEVLKSFGFDYIEALPLNLSWGQQTRLATLLAYSVAKNGILLLDEPFTGSTYIDSVNIVNTLGMLSDVTKIVTVSSRDYIALLRNARVYALDDGVLKPLVHQDNDIVEGIKLAYKWLS